jgi:hypothetical protein
LGIKRERELKNRFLSKKTEALVFQGPFGSKILQTVDDMSSVYFLFLKNRDG